ncbi:MAG TPA: hypothetical protein VGG74_28630 [Kofleriaceae bacterium]
MAYSFDPDVYEPDVGREQRVDFWTDVLLAAFQAVPSARMVGGANGYLDRLLHEAVWGVTVPVHTDASKYFWQRYLSEEVEKKFRQACSLKRLNQKAVVEGLRHEHVIEVNKLMGHLRTAAPNGRSALRTVLATAVACVVTDEEHTSLGKARVDGWERYKKTGVRVWDRSRRGWCAMP